MSEHSFSASEAAATIADIAVAGTRASGDGLLSYAVPAHMRDSIGVGQVVWVPLRGKPALGVIVRLHEDAPVFAVKPILATVDPPTRVSVNQLDTARWLARQSASSLYDALSLFLPPGVSHRVQPYLRLINSGFELSQFTPAQGRLLKLLAERGETSLEAARSALGTRLTSVVPALEEAGVIATVYRVSDRLPKPRKERWIRLRDDPDVAVLDSAPAQEAIVTALRRRTRVAGRDAAGFIPEADILGQSGSNRASLAALIRKGMVEEVERIQGLHLPVTNGSHDRVPELTPSQSVAWSAIERALHAGGSIPFLLYGVTGSGKTELYLRAAAWCLRHGKSALVLVPEIALSSQVADRFASRFGDRVAILHSGLSDAERYAAWQGIAAGRYLVVVGPRSALFAPAPHVGLIVLDEEHDPAYKQDSVPRYHARSVAEHLAKSIGAVLILGSATPSVETFWRSRQGDVRLLALPERVGPELLSTDGSRESTSLELPRVDIVDMRLELHRGNTSLLSVPLQELLAGTLRRKEQAILLLNRRGLATVVLCRACGTILQCPYCDIPLVYHQDRERLVCHRCDYREAPRRSCPTCNGPLDYFGAGTQRVEGEVRRLFPAARVLRWDQDAVRRAGGSEGLLRQVERGETDVVVGTQMVSKGFDLPRVTAIGVVNADTGLHLPDFRSGERTFSLLTQVAGRAGRRGPGSRVIVQSYTPEHYAIQAASRHDYDGFFTEEIDFRRQHRYPPFVRLARYLYRSRNDAACAKAADQMARKLARHARERGVRMDLLGPSPAFASRVRGEYQWQVILRSPDLESLLDGIPVDPGWTVDIDPQSLL
jgi:primosomal protein N' (replication factor Y) (superfamily II helicase)